MSNFHDVCKLIPQTLYNPLIIDCSNIYPRLAVFRVCLKCKYKIRGGNKMIEAEGK